MGFAFAQPLYATKAVQKNQHRRILCKHGRTAPRLDAAGALRDRDVTRREWLFGLAANVPESH
jgi:hypothetical protein